MSEAEQSNLAPARITNVNHIAYRCRDAEQTRWFYEDVLELPLRIAVQEEEIPGVGTPSPFMHLFFEMPNGDFVAFFDEPGRASSKDFEPADSFDRHLAFEVDTLEDVLSWQKKINEKGVMCLGPVEHGFVTSVYMYDPNGLQLEITTRDPNFTNFAQEQRGMAREQLDAWVERTRALKEEKFGSDALDLRDIIYPTVVK
ncbi:MAG: VOC family protein [Erythrobacter sp.]